MDLLALSENTYTQLFTLIGSAIAAIGVMFNAWISYKQAQLRTQVTQIKDQGEDRSNKLEAVSQKVDLATQKIDIVHDNTQVIAESVANRGVV